MGGTAYLVCSFCGGIAKHGDFYQISYDFDVEIGSSNHQLNWKIPNVFREMPAGLST